MSLNFAWINLLILFGALQALVFAVILLFQRKHPGVTFFSAFIFVFAYNGFERSTGVPDSIGIISSSICSVSS